MIKTEESKAGKKKILIMAFLWLVAACQFFPVIWIAVFSLCKSSELFASGILRIPDPPQWQNYAIAWTQGHVLKYFINSVFVTASAISITVVLSITLGYAFTRMEWKLRGFFLGIIMLGMMVPIHSTLLPNFLFYKKLDWLNTYQSLIVPYTGFALPIGVLLMTGFMKTLPKSLEESAIIDGCGTYGIIFRIISPLTKPAIVTVSIMTFLSCWNEFIMAMTFLSKSAMRTLPFSVYEFAGQYVSNYAVQFAVMAITALPAIIIYILLNERITKGVTVGAVKG